MDRHIHIHIHLDGLEDEPIVVGKKSIPTQRKAAGSTKEPAASVVREWAQAQGFEVSKTGKPRRELVKAYIAAH